MNSLLHFYEECVQKRLPVSVPRLLDLGPGLKSIFNGENVTAIDREEWDRPTSLVHYQKISLLDFYDDEKFDLVFDSHMLHCLVQEHEFKNAFKKVYELLKKEGLFASEMMIEGKHLTHKPADRMIKSAFELEAIIKESGFKIIYFYIQADLTFESEGHADVLRFIAQK